MEPTEHILELVNRPYEDVIGSMQVAKDVWKSRLGPL